MLTNFLKNICFIEINSNAITYIFKDIFVVVKHCDGVPPGLLWAATGGLGKW